MNHSRLILMGITLLLASCATGTIAQLKDEKVDLKDEKIEGGLDKAIQSYQLYVDKMPSSKMTPESILRLADLKIKKEFDFLEGGVDGETSAQTVTPIKSGDNAKEALQDFEKRTTSGGEIKSIKVTPGATGTGLQSAGTQEAIKLYKKLLSDYPNYELNDQALYKLARIYEELGNPEEAISMMDRLAKGYPHSRYIDEVQFRRGEYYYARKKFLDAQEAYKAIIDIGAKSSYYEFALYKLGWTYYKQDRYEGALQQFVALLDHKVTTGYDLDHPKDAFDEKRIEDTYRVMSLSFSYLGGADAVEGYFNKYGKRAFELSVYKNLGDYYLEKLRYGDAAATFKSFAKSNPFHKKSPYFELWAMDSYKKGGFPKFVIESDKEFVSHYGLKSAYWTHADAAAFNEISGYVKASLKELVNYYHAQYQDNRPAKDKDENFQEAVKWCRVFLDSFPKDESALSIHYQLAELLLENKWYIQAAVEFEHIAYDYPPHSKSADAGYTAIYALRKGLAIALPDEADHVKRDIIRNSLKFAETFQNQGERASLVMSAALDDIYAMKMYGLAAVTARKIIARYSGSDQQVRRAAWLIYSHSSFESGIYKDAEEGYHAVLGLMQDNDPARAGVIENLAASLYKQGEQANKLGDYTTAATYFLLVGTDAPTANIRPVADFDGITALIQSKNLIAAADQLSAFRTNHPGNPQQLELSKKLALAYREAGNLPLAAAEYERLSNETPDAVFQRASLELAAELYSEAKDTDKAYTIYRRYVNIFPKPLEDALEMRDKIAAYLKTGSDMNLYLNELKQIMDLDAKGGAERTDRTRYLGAKAGLALAEFIIKQFIEIKLENPYAESLLKKQNAMKVAKERLEGLLDYETDIVTSAATYYLAEMYYDFSRSLVSSERPFGLKGKEKEQYELSIEEQSYLFEEKTIQVHQKNLELMSRGIYNSWIEKSIEKLAKLVPAKYAKFEESSGYVKEIDNVSYAALTNPKRAGGASSDIIPPADGSAPARELSSDQKKEIDAAFAEAMQSLKVVQYEKAIKLLSKIIAQSPNNPVPYINIALINEKKQNSTLAEENLKLAIKVDPGNPVANNEYALLYRKTGRFNEARQVYEKILERYPSFTMAHKNLGILCDIYLKDNECALKHYSVYSDFTPNDGAVKIWIADIRGR